PDAAWRRRPRSHSWQPPRRLRRRRALPALRGAGALRRHRHRLHRHHRAGVHAGAELARAAAPSHHAQRPPTPRSQPMTESRSIAATVHAVIDDVTTAVEDIHKSVAEFLFTMLGEITPFKETLDDVKVTQEQTIGAVDGLGRTSKDQVRR